MEAVATPDLWIWHAFVGLGSNNDIYVLDRSPLYVEWFKNPALKAEIILKGRKHSGCYLLADGIYPDSRLFVKTVSNPQSSKLKHFAKIQEAWRKDVERCFGILKSRFVILNSPARLWKVDLLKDIWTATVILHNMISEDERNEGEEIGDIAVIPIRGKPVRFIPYMAERNDEHRSSQSFTVRSD